MNRQFTCFIKKPLARGRGHSLALHGRKWCLLSSQLVRGAEVDDPSMLSPEGPQCASPCLPCHCLNGHDDRRMDRGPAGQPDSENRKPNLLKIMQGEERK